jgi:hypothetical protein
MGEEDVKLCARRQTSQQSQLAATFPSLATHTTLEKALGTALGDLTPPPPHIANTVNGKGGLGPLA